MIRNSATLVPWNAPRSVFVSMVLLTALLLGALSATAPAASAQIRSDWASFDAQYSSYTTPYQCRSLTTRTGRIALGLVDHDTLSTQVTALQKRVPTEAKSAAEQCLRRIVVDSLTRVELMPVVGLYLVAGRDKDAAAVIERMLKGQWRPITTDSLSMLGAAYSAGTDGNKRKAAIHYTAATTYLNSIPARFSAALSHLDSFERLTPEEGVVLVNQYWAIFHKAKELGDSVVMRSAIQHIVDIGETMTTADRQKVTTAFFAVEQYRTAQARFDSLRLNSEAYIALQKSQLYKLGTNDRWLGTTMDTLQGEFRWPAAAVYPTPGKITLVMVLGDKPISSHAIFPMLRRLKQKHAELEILYVSRTGGQLGTSLLEPAQQAETERRWVQDVWKMPFSVLIENSPTWRLPEPDRRLIYGATPNSETYKNHLWLVDRVGTIVFYSPIVKDAESTLDQLIAVLRQQR